MACFMSLWRPFQFFNTSAASPRKPVLFLHIQKTAGTSVIHRLKEYYRDSMVTHGDWLGKSPQDLAHLECVTGHFGHAFAAPLMRGRYCFTFLRDPADRLISKYYYFQKQKSSEFIVYELARKHSFDEFLELSLDNQWLKINMWNNQTWMIAHGYDEAIGKEVVRAQNANTHQWDDSVSALQTINRYAPEQLLQMAKSHLKQFDQIGFVERLDQDFAKITQALGLGAMPLGTINRTENRPSYKELAPETRRRIDRMTELDRELYDYAFALNQ